MKRFIMKSNRFNHNIRTFPKRTTFHQLQSVHFSKPDRTLDGSKPIVPYVAGLDHVSGMSTEAKCQKNHYEEMLEKSA